KKIATEERSLVVTGDRVWILPLDDGRTTETTPAPPVHSAPSTQHSALIQVGVIERVEPRHGVLTRASKGREHVLVANVDQVVIVVALKEPELKLHLIDRYLASAQQGDI